MDGEIYNPICTSLQAAPVLLQVSARIRIVCSTAIQWPTQDLSQPGTGMTSELREQTAGTIRVISGHVACGMWHVACGSRCSGASAYSEATLTITKTEHMDKYTPTHTHRNTGRHCACACLRHCPCECFACSLGTFLELSQLSANSAGVALPCPAFTSACQSRSAKSPFKGFENLWRWWWTHRPRGSDSSSARSGFWRLAQDPGEVRKRLRR